MKLAPLLAAAFSCGLRRTRTDAPTTFHRPRATSLEVSLPSRCDRRHGVRRRWAFSAGVPYHSGGSASRLWDKPAAAATDFSVGNGTATATTAANTRGIGVNDTMSLHEHMPTSSATPNLPSPVVPSVPSLPPDASAVLWLNAVAVLWGTQHAVIKSVVQDTDPSVFTLVRFALAAALATVGLVTVAVAPATEDAPVDGGTTTRRTTADGDPLEVGRWGAELGTWMFLGFCFQAIGLQDTTAQKSGFLLYLNVKIVPFLAGAFLGREISPATWASAGTALAGTLLLLLAGQLDASSAATTASEALPLLLRLLSLENWNVGDAWSVAAAFASAAFILRLEQASQQVPNTAALNVACLWTVAALSGLWSWNDVSLLPHRLLWDDVTKLASSHTWELAYLSGVATALANWIQAKAQRSVPAERAAVIYAMDPVYGAIFAYWLLGERLEGWTGWVGAGLIAVAAIGSAWVEPPNPLSTPPDDPKRN